MVLQSDVSLFLVLDERSPVSTYPPTTEVKTSESVTGKF